MANAPNHGAGDRAQPSPLISKCMTLDEQKDELRKISANDNLWLYDHFGSTDAEGLLARMSWLAAG